SSLRNFANWKFLVLFSLGIMVATSATNFTPEPSIHAGLIPACSVGTSCVILLPRDQDSSHWNAVAAAEHGVYQLRHGIGDRYRLAAVLAIQLDRRIGISLSYLFDLFA